MLLHVAAASLPDGLGSVGLHCCLCVITLVTQGVDFLCHVHFVEVKTKQRNEEAPCLPGSTSMCGSVGDNLPPTNHQWFSVLLENFTEKIKKVVFFSHQS